MKVEVTEAEAGLSQREVTLIRAPNTYRNQQEIAESTSCRQGPGAPPRRSSSIREMDTTGSSSPMRSSSELGGARAPSRNCSEVGRRPTRKIQFQKVQLAFARESAPARARTACSTTARTDSRVTKELRTSTSPLRADHRAASSPSGYAGGAAERQPGQLGQELRRLQEKVSPCRIPASALLDPDPEHQRAQDPCRPQRSSSWARAADRCRARSSRTSSSRCSGLRAIRRRPRRASSPRRTRAAPPTKSCAPSASASSTASRRPSTCCCARSSPSTARTSRSEPSSSYRTSVTGLDRAQHDPAQSQHRDRSSWRPCGKLRGPRRLRERDGEPVRKERGRTADDPDGRGASATAAEPRPRADGPRSARPARPGRRRGGNGEHRQVDHDHGRSAGEEDLVIEGKVEGKVDAAQQPADDRCKRHDKAEINAKSVVVIGSVAGNVRGTERIEIEATGIVDGDVVHRAWWWPRAPC